MAVTYAWRLDSNKFAYIVPPYDLTGNTVSNEYGFLSDTPLTDYFLRAVATTAESKFGKNGVQGLSGYTAAFAAMEQKIAEAATANGHTQQGKDIPTPQTFSGWTGMEHADLLSADVYYNVDSEDCADLRGVGIKGTRYLGSIRGDAATDGSISSANLENMTYIPSGSSATTYTWVLNRTTNEWEKSIVDVPVVQPGIPGFVDVYGIYLTDNLEGDETVETTNQTPEYMFVIRNGGYGPQGPQGDPLVIDGEIEASLTTKAEFNALSSEVSTLKTAVSAVTNNMETLTQYYNTISLDNINNLIVMVSNLQKQLSRLEQYLFGFELPDVTTDTDDGGLPGGGTGKIQIVPLGLVSGDSVSNGYNDYEGDTYSSGAMIEGWGEEDDVKTKQFHLLGYLEDSAENDEYLKTDGDGNRKMPTITRLYSLPNVKVSLTGITFGNADGSDKNMDVKVNGNVLSSGIVWGEGGLGTPAQINAQTVVASSNVISKDKMYAKNGFYQEDKTTTDNTKPDMSGNDLPFTEEPQY